MSHSLTLLAHCQSLVSQIRQTLLTAQQIAWLGDRTMGNAFRGETNMQNKVSRGYISYNEISQITMTAWPQFLSCLFLMFHCWVKSPQLKLLWLKFLYALSKLKKLSRLNLSKNQILCHMNASTCPTVGKFVCLEKEKHKRFPLRHSL